ncbi:MAG: 4-hydroxybenzoate polyprenyltransferase [Planctomycetes bacterium]|nr:4-hydroxybenzoate polyprenyltransferase [Planctomycetota bacterium]
MTETSKRRGRGGLLAWLQLCRAPNAFTAVADVMMGYLVARGNWEPAIPFVLLVLAGAALYTAGIVLNDLFDIDIDRRERPERPLPSGRVSVRAARRLGVGLLAAGCALAAAAPRASPAFDGSPWLPGAVAAVLVAAIVAYDVAAKDTWLGPFVMGSCRALNALLGMSVASIDDSTGRLPWAAEHLCVAIGLGVYVAGITWFGRSEAGTSRRARLAAGLTLMIAGWVLVARLPSLVSPHAVARIPVTEVWYLLLALLGIPVLRRAFAAITRPDSRRVQLAVRQAIWSIIWLDAAVAIVVAPPVFALTIAGLFLPMILLGRWVYST